jgi:UDPglucose 6-dehydrogenase
MSTVSVVGLGKLGACMAACIASRGHTVIGVDLSPTTIGLVNSGQPPVVEPGLEARMSEVGARLTATDDYDEAIGKSEITFIVVPTPSESLGVFSLRHVREAALGIGRALRRKSTYHLVVITSTVLPGSSEYGVLPVLERESGKRCGEDFGFCYGPEFIALGSVIRDFLNPDFVLIGESDKRAGDLLAELYQSICENQPPVARMNLINAELTKISINTFVTMKITFANMLAAMCEQLPGGDIDQVTAGLGLDSRIGPRYLKGALGYGGPCFPRDNLALAYLARELGQTAPLAEATDEYNRTIVDRLAERIIAHSKPSSVIAVLGLAYKPDTNVVEESQGLQLAARLAAKGLRVMVYDPLALENARQILGDAVHYAGSVEECVRKAEVLVIANPNREFASILADLLALRPGQVVFDAWRSLRRRFVAKGTVSYVPLGVGERTEESTERLQNLWSERLQVSAR